MKNIYFADISALLHSKNILKENEQVVGIVNQTILLERKTPKNFSYRIVDPITFKTYHICTRKLKLPKDRYDGLREKIAKWGDFGICLPMLELSDTIRSKNLLREIFETILPKQGMRFRDEQMKLSIHILEALEKNLIALCEAEVGTGKTHAYILATMCKNLFTLDKKSTVISTSTIALQNALTQEYLPQISQMMMKQRILDKPLEFVVRKGKGHYVCDLRLLTFISTLKQQNPSDLLIEELSKLNYRSVVVDLDTIALSEHVKKRICVTNCEKKCPYSQSCSYQEFMKKCRENYYDYQIVNHNYLIANMLHKKQNGKYLLANFEQIIIDEAHKLPDTIKSMYRIELKAQEIVNTIKAIKDSMDDIDGIGFRQIIVSSEKVFNQLRRSATPTGSLIMGMDIQKEFTLLNIRLNKLSNDNRTKELKKFKRTRPYVFQLEEIINKITLFTGDYVYWVEKNKENQSILFALSKKLNKKINDDLWSLNIPIIMTSGTMSINGDFSHLEHSIGLCNQSDKIMRTTATSPFDYDKQALLYLSPNIPYPNAIDKKYLEAVIQEIYTLIQVTYGHTLILFTSYQMMEQVFWEIQKTNLPYPLFSMGKGSLTTIANFRKSKNGVLFASDSAGEGIDLAGDILSSLIVVKLPFPIPNAVAEHELKLQGDFEKYLNSEIIPSMLIKLRQWFGRGIRRETDTCVFTILDGRASGRYFKAITATLPVMPITMDIIDVEQFILNKKNNSYFE